MQFARDPGAFFGDGTPSVGVAVAFDAGEAVAEVRREQLPATEHATDDIRNGDPERERKVIAGRLPAQRPGHNACRDADDHHGHAQDGVASGGIRGCGVRRNDQGDERHEGALLRERIENVDPGERRAHHRDQHCQRCSPASHEGQCHRDEEEDVERMRRRIRLVRPAGDVHESEHEQRDRDRRVGVRVQPAPEVAQSHRNSRY